jgi:hypothetical protein
MGLNFIGYPIGTTLAGVIAAVSIEAAIIVGAIACLVAAASAVVLIPRHVPDVRRTPSEAARPAGRTEADAESRPSAS